MEAQLAECMQHFLQLPGAHALQKRAVPCSPLQPAAPAFNSSLSKHENSAVIEFRASADRAAFVKQAAAREIIWLVKSLASAASSPLRSFSFNLLTGRSNIKWAYGSSEGGSVGQSVHRQSTDGSKSDMVTHYLTRELHSSIRDSLAVPPVAPHDSFSFCSWSSRANCQECFWVCLSLPEGDDEIFCM